MLNKLRVSKKNKENWPDIGHFRRVKLDIIMAGCHQTNRRSLETCWIENKLARGLENFPYLVSLYCSEGKTTRKCLKKNSFCLLINGAPVNGLPFHVVHAKRAGHQVWLIPLPTGTHCPRASALHQEEHLIKMLNTALVLSSNFVSIK